MEINTDAGIARVGLLEMEFSVQRWMSVLQIHVIPWFNALQRKALNLDFVVIPVQKGTREMVSNAPPCALFLVPTE